MVFPDHYDGWLCDSSFMWWLIWFAYAMADWICISFVMFDFRTISAFEFNLGFGESMVVYSGSMRWQLNLVRRWCLMSCPLWWSPFIDGLLWLIGWHLQSLIDGQLKCWNFDEAQLKRWNFDEAQCMRLKRWNFDEAQSKCWNFD